MTITCDTPIESLLDVEEVREQTDEYTNVVTQTTESLLTTITSEQAKGLSPDAFVIDGDSLIYEKAQTIKTNHSIHNQHSAPLPIYTFPPMHLIPKNHHYHNGIYIRLALLLTPYYEQQEALYYKNEIIF